MKLRIATLFLLLVGCTAPQLPEKEVIRKGNVISLSYDPEAEAGCYLANGRFGAVFSGLGLNKNPGSAASGKTGSSHFSHLNHWGRFSFTSARTGSPTTADYLLPLFSLFWEDEPQDVSAYRQELDFYDGILRTSFTTSEGVKVQIQGWFDIVDKDMAGFSFDLSEGTMPVRAVTATDFLAYPYVFRDKVSQSTLVEKSADAYKVTVSCENAVNDCVSNIYIHSSAPVEICGDGLRFLLSKGRNELFICYGHPSDRQSRDASMRRTTRGWHELWHETGWIDFPEENAARMWVRSTAYLLSSHMDTETGLIQPTNGLSGNPFPFHFVQDLEYIAPALMMTGHGDIVRAWVEKFAGQIGDMQAYAKKLWPSSEGIYPPWELPFGPIDGYHEPEVPVVFCYEPHNVGYLARLAWEAAQYFGDHEWAAQYAYPILSECARFYLSASIRGEDGHWHQGWYPSVGQDEAGGRDKTDYLCSLYSSLYTFQAAVAAGLDTDGRIAALLSDGLAFDSLLAPEGFLHTTTGADDFGRQKHPVQLDGLSYFPVSDGPLDYELKAYSVRHDITDRAHEPYFFGWTLGQFLLAGSNAGDAQGWIEDWNLMRPSGYTDKDWIQVYETSRKPDSSFYVTTHGMIAQSLIRNYVNDYWGDLRIGSCNVFADAEVHFSNISTIFGVKVSGYAMGNRAKITLKADRDASFRLNGEDVSIPAGETRTFVLNMI